MARTKKSYQRGTVEKHNGFWTVRYYLLDDEGKKIKKREKLPISRSSLKRAALNAAEPIMLGVNEQNNNPRQVKQRLTFHQFVTQFWKAYQVNEGLKDSTIRSYESMIDNHIMPAFEKMLINEISPADITRFFNQLRGKASAKYALNVYALLNTMFEVALQYDVLDVKPVRSKLHKPKHEAEEKPTLTIEEVRNLLIHVEESYRLFFAVLFATGVRIGEGCAFRWLNFDPETRSLQVTNSIWRGALATTKTKASERPLRLNQVLVDLLKEHRAHAVFKGPEDYIFCRSDGRPYESDHLRECVLYPAMDKVGIARTPRAFGFHLLRHTAGSVLYKQTKDMKQVQRALGHSREQTTSDIYVHMEPDEVAEGTEILGDIILKGIDLFRVQETDFVN